MKNLNIQFIDEHDNDVTFDVLANDSQVNIVEIRIPGLSVSKNDMYAYALTVCTLLSHPQTSCIEDLLSWLVDAWDEQKDRAVVQRYLYDHLTDCFCGFLED